jgi:tetratricopeptide (TPR) repeat protein
MRLRVADVVMPREAFFLLVVWLICLQVAVAQTSSTPPPSMLLEARSDLAVNNYAQAEAIYRHLLQTSPEEPVVVEGLALSLYLQGKDTPAIGVLRQSRVAKTDTRALALLASSYCRLAQYDEATAVLRRLKPWPKDDAFLSQIAPCVLVAGDPLDGPAVYERLVADTTQPGDEYAVGLARAYIQVSRLVLTRLRELRDNQPYVDAVEGARTSSTADAMSVFEAAQKAVPSLRHEMSLDAMAALLREHPESPPVLYGVGVISGERGIQAYADAEDRYPNSIQLLLLKAEMLASLERLDEAVSAYQEILREHPDSPGVHFLIGDLYRTRHRWDDALEELRAQEKITPHDERILEAIDGCLQGAGRLVESYSYLKPLVSRGEAPKWALVDFGVAAKNTDHPQEAIAALQRAEAIDPSDASIHYRLYLLFRETHQTTEAATELGSFKRLKEAERAAVSKRWETRK